MDQTVQPLDLARMFFGQQEPLFFLEIVVRTTIVYAYGLLLLRWLGSRTIGQLSTVEFLLVIALGSAVGDPMFYPQVPVLAGMAVITVVVLLNKALDMMIVRSKGAERVLDGKPVQVVEQGVLCDPDPASGTMGRSELFQQLRQRGISNLGQVEHAFVEPDGALTMFRAADARAGLPIVPPWEIAEPIRLGADRPLPEPAALACRRCGATRHVEQAARPGCCPSCGHDAWTYAAIGGTAPPPSMRGREAKLGAPAP